MLNRLLSGDSPRSKVLAAILLWRPQGLYPVTNR